MSCISLVLLALGLLPTGLAAQAAVQIAPGVISTLAGVSATGDSGGMGSGEQQIAVDNSGNVYVADSMNSMVQKVAPNGAVTTVAGTGTAGYSTGSGIATSAELNYPEGVAVDSAGNVYIADTSNCLIRKVDTSGNITNVAGTPGSCGDSANGTVATSGKVENVASVSVDSAGDIYYTEPNQYLVREVVASTGEIETVAGTGTTNSSNVSGTGGQATSAQLLNPQDAWVTNNGLLYILDVGWGELLKVNLSTGILTMVAGTNSRGYSGDGGPASSALFNNPSGIGVDRFGNVFIADSGNSVVREISASTGYINTVAGNGSAGSSGDGGVATSANMNWPSDAAAGPDGALYILDQNNNEVRKVTPGMPTFPDTAVGSSAAAETLYFQTTASVTLSSIALQAGFSDFTVGALSGTGCALNTAIASSTICGVAVTFNPKAPGLRQDPLVITDSNGNKAVFGLSGIGTGPAVALLSGTISTVAGTGSQGYTGDGGAATAAQIWNPAGVVVDSAGNLYFTDSGNNVVRKVDAATGNISTIAGNGTSGHSGDGGAATSAQLNYPFGLAVDAAGDVYIDENSACVVRKVDAATGIITTVAGTGTCGSSSTGTAATSAELNDAFSIAVDQLGNLYIADSGNNVVRKVDTNGNISTVAGTMGSSGSSGDGGLATAALLNQPAGVAVDAAGDLYIMDLGNRLVRKVAAGTGIITTVAGNTSASAGTGDGSAATAAGLNSNDVGVAVDNGGDLLIATNTADTLRRVDAGSGIINTIAGNGTAADTGDGGPATSAELNRPMMVAADDAGNLYLSDYLGNRVRKISNASGGLNFGTGTLSVTTSAQTVTVSNTGNSTLTFTGLSFSSSVFAQTTSGGTDCSSSTTLAAGASCEIAVTATPASAGTTTGTLTITDNTLNASGSQQTVALSVSAKQSQTITFPTVASQTVGNSVTLTATASSGLAVTYKVDSGPGSLSGSTLTLTGPGTVVVEADQAGDSTWAAASAASQSITVTANATTTSLSVSPSTSATPGQPVAMTATVSPASNGSYSASGTVTFYDGATSLGTGTLASGTATYSTTSLALGAHTLKAVYGGDTNFATSTSSTSSLTVANSTTTALTASAASLTLGGLETLTATVNSGGNGVAGGTMTFLDGTTTLGTVQVQGVNGTSGTAILNTTSLAVGSHSITAKYSGIDNYTASTSTAQTVTVTGTYASTTSIASSGSAGSYTLTATVAGAGPAPSGTVNFLDTSNSNLQVATATLSTGAATSGFSTKSTPATQVRPDGIAVGDFNHDGSPDIAVVNGTSDTVSVLLSNGDGTFQAQHTYATGVAPWAVATGDFNGDGNLDLAVTNPTSDTVSIFLGSSNGTFTADGTVSTGGSSGPYGLAVGDFNNDGIPDLAVVNHLANKVEIFTGNGDGTFTAGNSYPVGTTPYAVAVGDFNGDGNLDLAVANHNSANVTVLLGNGDGTFTSEGNFGVGTDPYAIAVGDFNEDGHPDLAVVNYINGNVGILLNNGSGSFGAQTTYATGTDPEAVTVGDFNGDGHQDLAVANYINGNVAVLLGNGNGTFQAKTTYAVGTDPNGVATGDFNGDGRLDLAVDSYINNNVSVLLGQQTETATATGVSVPGGGSHAIEASYAGDSSYGSSASSTASLTGTPISTTTTLGLSATSGVVALQSEKLTATVSPASGDNYSASGTVTFYDNNTSIGTGTLSGSTATLTISSITGGSHSFTATYGGDTNFATSTTASAQALTVSQLTPAVTWAAPAAITYGTALSATQLNASSTVAGTFSYSPAAGTVLGAGSQTLTVTFTPTDTTDYKSATKTVSLTVNQATLTVTAQNATRTYGAANPTFTDTITGFVNGDTAAVVTGTASLTSSATTASTVGPYAIAAAQGTLAAANYSFTFVPGTLTVTQATPTVTWTTPTAITYGTALSATQLDAASTVAGTFSYSPAAGTVLGAGSQTLTVTFTPTDSTDYTTATQTVSLTVNQAVLTVTAQNATRTYGAANPTFTDTITGFVNGDTAATAVIGAAALTTSATTSSAVGTYAITAAQGTLSAANYSFTFVPGTLTVTQATPTVTWTTPTAITYGTALTATQLDASSTVAGTFTYSPAAGTVLGAGTQTLSVTFTPADTTDYATVTQTVTLTVNQAMPAITWATPRAITYGTPLLATQLNAASTMPGTFAYSPAAGTILLAGTQTLSVTFTPTDTTDYTTATQTVSLTITQATPAVTWTAPTAITYGTALSATQLDAASTVAGTFAYSPAGGTILPAGTQTLSVTFTPTDTTDYTTATKTVMLTVNPAVLTVTAGNFTRNYGAANPGFTYTISGFVAGQTAADALTGTPSLTTTATLSSPAAIYPITPGQGTLVAPNYTFVFVPGTLGVTPAQPIVELGASATAIVSPASVVLTATVMEPRAETGGTPTGTVLFGEGSAVLGSAPISNGVATFTVTSPAVGTHNYVAGYEGDLNNQAAGSPVVTVTVEPPPALAALSVASLTFSKQIQGSASAPQTVTFTNPGGSPLPISSIAASGDFSESNSCGVALAAGASCAITVSFNPTAAGARNGALTVNDSVGTQNVVLSGTGAAVWLTPSSFYFGGVNVGSSLGPLNMELTNGESQALTGLAISMTGDYSETDGCGTSLGAGQTCSILITYTPTGTNVRNGTISISTQFGTITGQLSGLGLSSAISALTVLTKSLNFGSQMLGTTGLPVAVTLVNNTSAPVNVGTIAVTGDFKQTNTCPATLKPGESCNVQVSFQPSSAGSLTGALTFGSSSSVGLTGVGAEGNLQLQPGNVDFGSQLVGTTSLAQTVLVTDIGNGPVTINGSGTDGDFGEGDTCSGATLQPGGQCTVNVVFSPSAVGPRSGNVVLNSNAGPADIGVSGNGTAPGASLYPSALAFGSVPVGQQSPAQTVTLKNTGTATLTGILVAPNGDLKQVNDCGNSLAAGADCTINVSLQPSTSGPDSGSVVVTDSVGDQVVYGNGTGIQPGASLSPSSLAFGSEAVGSQSAPRTVTLTNTGNTGLRISTVTVQGDFRASNACPAILRPSQSCAINVTSKPSSSGTRTGTLSVSDDAPGGVQTVSLSGSGVPAGVTLTPAEWNFGSLPIGSSAQQPVTLTNGLTVPVTIVSLSATGDLKVSSNCGAVVAAGGSCTLTVSMIPQLTGGFTGQLILNLAAPGGLAAAGPAAHALAAGPHAATGSGTFQAFLQLQAQVSPATVTLSPGTLNFGSEAAGATSAAQTVTLTNSGGTALNIQGISASADFAETNTCPASLNAGASCAMQVTFTSAAAGGVTGALSVVDDQGTQAVALTGSGLQPGLSVSPANLRFASTVVGQTSPAQTVTVTNSGSSAYTLGPVAASGDFAEASNCGTSLAAGASCAVQVTFTPAAGGTRTGALTVAGASPITVPLTGTGNTAALQLSASQLSFGSSLLNAKSATQTVTVTNTSAAAIPFTSIAATGDFSATNTCGTSLAVGASCTVSVVFDPTAMGSRAGTLTLTDGSPDSPQTVSLSGTGNDLALALTAPGGGATVNAGQAASYTVSLTPNGFTGPVTLSCGGPLLTTCLVTPQQVTLAGNQAATLTVQVRTAAGAAVPPLAPPAGPGSPNRNWGLLAAALALLLFIVTGLAQGRRRVWAMAVMLVGMALLFAACGGAPGIANTQPGTPAGRYSVTVTATTASGATRTTSLPLTIQ